MMEVRKTDDDALVPVVRVNIAVAVAHYAEGCDGIVETIPVFIEQDCSRMVLLTVDACPSTLGLTAL